MKVYFAGSIRGGRKDALVYKQIIDHIAQRANVLTEFVADEKLTVKGSAGSSQSIYQKDMDLLKQADCVVAECSSPSLGVGYEIASAENLGKPILALYKPTGESRLSAMIGGCPNVTIFEYAELEQALSAVANFLNYIDHRLSFD